MSGEGAVDDSSALGEIWQQVLWDLPNVSGRLMAEIKAVGGTFFTAP